MTKQEQNRAAYGNILAIPVTTDKMHKEFDEEDIENIKPVTPRKLMEIFSKVGAETSQEQAEQVLAFLRNFANIAVSQSLETHAGRGL